MHALWRPNMQLLLHFVPVMQQTDEMMNFRKVAAGHEKYYEATKCKEGGNAGNNVDQTRNEGLECNF